MEIDLTTFNQSRDEWCSFPTAQVMKLKHNMHIWQQRFKENLNLRYRLYDFMDLLHSELVSSGVVLIRQKLSFDNVRKYRIQQSKRDYERENPALTQSDWKALEQELIHLKYKITEVPDMNLVVIEC